MSGLRAVRARGRGAALGCAVQGVALLWLAVLGAGGALVWPALSRDLQQLIVPLVLGTWAATLLPATAILGLVLIVRRNAALDRVFADVGPGRALAPVARAWAGTREGRALNVWFSKGPRLEIYLSASPRTEVGIGRASMVSRLAGAVTGREAISLDAERTAYGVDPAWTRRLLAAPRARTALDGLLDEDGRSIRVVSVLPDAVKLTVAYFDLNALDHDVAEAEVGRLLALAQVVDALPPPEAPLEPRGVAARMRTERGSLGRFLAVTVGCSLGLVALIGGTTAVIVLLVWTPGR